MPTKRFLSWYGSIVGISLALLTAFRPSACWIAEIIKPSFPVLFKLNQKTTPMQYCPNVKTTVSGAKISIDLLALDFSQDRNLSHYLQQGWTGMLGRPAMKNHVWHFDFKNNIWSLER
jgi:hypothetical protein